MLPWKWPGAVEVRKTRTILLGVHYLTALSTAEIIQRRNEHVRVIMWTAFPNEDVLPLKIKRTLGSNEATVTVYSRNLLRHISITPSRFLQNQTCCAERKRNDPPSPLHLISAIWRHKSFDVYPKLSKSVPTYQFTFLNNAWDFAIRYRLGTRHFRFINSPLARLLRHSLITPKSPSIVPFKPPVCDFSPSATIQSTWKPIFILQNGPLWPYLWHKRSF